MSNNFRCTLFFFSILFSNIANAVELIIGEELVEPGIVFVFEGAVKDHVMPVSLHLTESETNVHIEARVNWDEKDKPQGAPTGGFVPYLHITATVTNQKTKLSTFVDLVTHINLVDNFHYARNIQLPGRIEDLYDVKFSVTQPSSTDVAIHRDWLEENGKSILENQVFEYKNVNFEEIAKASRR